MTSEIHATAVAADAACQSTRTFAPRLTLPEASEYLRTRHGIRLAAKTLAKLRCISITGPAFVKAGRAVLYPQDKLDEYARGVISAPMRSTSSRNSQALAAA